MASTDFHVPPIGLWRSAARVLPRTAALLRRLGLTGPDADQVLTHQPTRPGPTTSTEQHLAEALRGAARAEAREGAVARFAAAHPEPNVPGPHSGAAMHRTTQTMGRTGLPAPLAWDRVRQQLAAERGGNAVATVFRLGEATILIVHGDAHEDRDPRGWRALYAWPSVADGPALARAADPA